MSANSIGSCAGIGSRDKIYIFGFSRGAFTARTLVALISSQGLVPAEIEGDAVSHGEMERNAMSAWRAYRRQTVPWNKSLPTIMLVRIVRNVVLAVYHFILRHRSYANVRATMKDRRAVEIEFLGLFDTVEAFGVPVEELRTAIDWAIWPISFRNRRLSHNVKRARHALSLDDERTSFHPIRFDQSNPRDAAAEDAVTKMWKDICRRSACSRRIVPEFLSSMKSPREQCPPASDVEDRGGLRLDRLHGRVRGREFAASGEGVHVR
jgi:hypothetical protein